MVGAQAFQTLLASRDGFCAVGTGQDLADQEHVVTVAGNGLPDEVFRATAAIHLRGIVQCQTTFDPRTQCGDLLRPTGMVVAEEPGALAHRRHG